MKKLWNRFAFWYFGIPELAMLPGSPRPPWALFERLRSMSNGYPSKIDVKYQRGAHGGKEWVFSWKAGDQNGSLPVWKQMRFYYDDNGGWWNLSENAPVYNFDITDPKSFYRPEAINEIQ